MRVTPEKGFYLVVLFCALSVVVNTITVGIFRAKIEEEYYRGLYDGCRQITHQTAACLMGAAQAQLFDYYGESSQGWQWPLPKTSFKMVPQPTPTRSHDGGA